MRFVIRGKTYFDPTRRLQGITLQSDSFEDERFIAAMFEALAGHGLIEIRTETQGVVLDGRLGQDPRAEVEG
jgi:hypothetical protein